MEIRRVISPMLLVCLGIVSSLLALEIGVRALNHYRPFVNTKFWVSDKLLGIRYIPNLKGAYRRPEYTTQFNINSAGWRDNQHSLIKPTGVFRILVLGDSFVESFQVQLEKTFFKILEYALNQEAPGKHFEAIALGVGGSSPTQQYFALVNDGLKYQPDLVIQAFYTQNDVAGNSPELDYSPFRGFFSLVNNELVYENAKATRDEEDVKSKPVFVFFRDRSFLWNFISDQLNVWRQNQLRASFATSSLGFPPDYQVYLKDYSPDWQTAWEVTQAILLKTKAAAETAGSKYLLVSLANIEQVEPVYWQQIRNQYPNLKNAVMDLKRPEEILSEFSKINGVSYLSLLPTFHEYKKAHPQTKLYYWQDTHWNEAGYKLAGETIAHYLRQTNLLE